MSMLKRDPFGDTLGSRDLRMCEYRLVGDCKQSLLLENAKQRARSAEESENDLVLSLSSRRKNPLLLDVIRRRQEFHRNEAPALSSYFVL